MSTTAVVTAPAKPLTFLQKMGQWFKEKFDPAAKIILQDATVAAEAAEPVIAVADPSVAPLYSTTVQLVTQAEGVAAAAGTQNGTGPQKLAAVTAALEPLATPYLKQIGVANPTTAQIQAYINSVVAGLNAFNALEDQPSTAQAQAAN